MEALPQEVQAQDESPTEPKTAQSQNSGSGGDAGGQTATSFDELMSRVSTGDGNRGQALVPEDLKADVRKLNHRIKSMNKFLMDPKSKFMQYWDFFTLGALLFTATVTPYEVRPRTCSLCPRMPTRCVHVLLPLPKRARAAMSGLAPTMAPPAIRWRSCQRSLMRCSSSTGSSISSSSWT